MRFSINLQVSLQFLVLPNFHSCFYNCMETSTLSQSEGIFSRMLIYNAYIQQPSGVGSKFKLGRSGASFQGSRLDTERAPSNITRILFDYIFLSIEHP